MTNSITHTMSAKVWAMLILLSILWGGSFFFVGIAVHELPPLTIVTLRVTLAALTLWLFAFFIGLRPPTSLKVWGSFLGMGLLNNVLPFILIVWGQTQIASGLAAILNAATPIFAVVVAGLLLPDEKPTPLKIFGVAIGFIGVVTVIGLPQLESITAIQNGHQSSVYFLAQLAIVTATICYALAGVYGRRFKTLGINPVLTAAGQVTASSLVLLPITITVEGNSQTFASVSNITWLAISALAVFSTAMAYVLYFKILAQAGATNVLLVTLLVPVSAILLGAAFLNESLATTHFIGMMIIALGLSAIDGRLWQKWRTHPS
ncbi:ABC transporter permease [Photobacterium jeanii]|uniref:ABC transporter permease n=1 Tax=Photobacterium jeanii TaxID=858640 RepID=A0A178K2D1_9GAMM|nr:DMT family transporter [Photobacterium jeanii]OAN10894.1 ABC transporter permease [Photobacterium jeanii]PST90409.1 EamA/RhaT family transporter [Photobacterium jeanii]